MENNKLEEAEDKVIRILTNQESSHMKIMGEKETIYVVFKKPPFSQKHKGRVWAAKKLAELGFTENVTEDSELTYYFRYWGTLNTQVVDLLVPSPSGDVVIEGKKYKSYEYDPKKDLDYESKFEKYAIKEYYDQGFSEENLVTSIMMAHLQWSRGRTIEEADVKNS